MQIQIVKLFVLVGLLALLSACASTATGRSQSAFSNSSQAYTLKNQPPDGTILAVVRYPAVVDTAAKDSFHKAFAQRAIGAKTMATQTDVSTQADNVVLKSNYFALSLYRSLAAKLPDHTVLLSPHEIKLGPGGKLTSEPLTKAELLASAVTVDFVAYTFPDSKKMMGRLPLTFGDLITPLVTVRTDYRGQAPTQGVLMASSPILGQTTRKGRNIVEAAVNELKQGRLTIPENDLDFIAYLNNEPTFQVPVNRLSGARQHNSVASYPLEKIRINKDVMKSLGDSTSNVDPFKEVFSEGFANQIINILNNTNLHRATMVAKAASISKFDENLGALTVVDMNDGNYQSRLRYAERLLEAEKKYLSVQSLRLYDGVYNGKIGKQMRSILVAEHEILEKRRSLARQQNMTTAAAVVGAVAIGAMAKDSNAGISAGEAIAADLLVQATIIAAQRAYQISQRSKALGETYMSVVMPIIEEHISVQIGLLDSNETVTAIRFEDLTEKLQTLYNKTQRSVDMVATRCGYKVAHLQTMQGTWLGACANGLANGPGIGILVEPNGKITEFYGHASNGLANGEGLQITHTATGSQSLEGNFTNGEVVGNAIVKKPGQPDTVRQFENGESSDLIAKNKAVIPVSQNQNQKQLVAALEGS